MVIFHVVQNVIRRLGRLCSRKDVLEYVKSILPTDIKVQENDRTILVGNRELDIYIPPLKLAIECNGLFWHGEINGNKDKYYHLNKTIECESKGIQLLHIFDDEWALSKEMVKKELFRILVSNTNFFDDRTITPLSCYIKKEGEKSILCVNKRWECSINNVYDKMKLKKVRDNPPSYWYYGRRMNYKRHSRNDFVENGSIEKMCNYDPTLSEWENMKNNGWDRVWDCGELEYEL